MTTWNFGDTFTISIVAHSPWLSYRYQVSMSIYLSMPKSRLLSHGRSLCRRTTARWQFRGSGRGGVHSFPCANICLRRAYPHPFLGQLMERLPTFFFSFLFGPLDCHAPKWE